MFVAYGMDEFCKGCGDELFMCCCNLSNKGRGGYPGNYGECRAYRLAELKDKQDLTIPERMEMKQLQYELEHQ